MNQADYKYTILHRGEMISNLMKTDIVEIYFNSRTHAEYHDQAKYIKDKLSRSYGNCWCVYLSDADDTTHHSFICKDELLFEFMSDSQHVLIYLLEPYLEPPHKEFYCDRTNIQMSARYGSRIVECSTHYIPNFEHLYRPYTSYYRVHNE